MNDDELTNYGSKTVEPDSSAISKEAFLKIFREKGLVFHPKFEQERVCDLYDRKELNDHLQRFVQHCAARGVKPTFEVILDWLYGKKAYDEKDEFVKISRLMEMVGQGEVYPLLILEVLNYALGVETAALKVFDELGHLSDEFDSLKELKESLSLRMEVRKDDKEKGIDVESQERAVSQAIRELFDKTDRNGNERQG